MIINLIYLINSLYVKIRQLLGTIIKNIILAEKIVKPGNNIYDNRRLQLTFNCINY